MKRKISQCSARHSAPQKPYIWKAIAWLQIILQLTIPFLWITPGYASDKNTDPQPENTILTSAATALAENNDENLTQQVRNGLINKATTQASSSAEQWLSHFGTAKVQLNVDQNGNWDESAIDLLMPLYDNKKSLLFSQFGLRAPDSRVTTNMGFGVRTFSVPDWMLGTNFFFDDDLTGKNRRVGIGMEAWTNDLKLSANTYAGTTQWHSSRDFDDYDEKPANGFDIRAEGYLPSQPQLGAKIVYEQYYGKNVALFDTDHLQNDPSAVTVGVNYTPVPLITMGTNYRRGQDSMDDLQFQLDLRYDFGHDWRYQITPENVALERSLAGSRYDLVERNNQIVMQYRKKEGTSVGELVLQTLTDRSMADGLTQNQVQVQVLNTKGEVMPDTGVAWTSTGQAKLSTTSSITDANGLALVNITDTTSETSTITATSGGVSAQTASHFSADIPATLSLSVDKNNSAADGVATDDATVVIKDSNQHPVPNAAVKWTITSPATFRHADAQTGDDGVAHAQIVSTKAGNDILTAQSGPLSQQETLTFVADSQHAAITRFDITQDKSPADGATANHAIIEVRDPTGNPMANMPVTLTANSATLSFATAAHRAASTMQTDAQGLLDLKFTDTVAEKVQLTATLSNGSSKQASTEFIADVTSASLQRLSVTTNGSPADGHSQDKAQVYVVDKNNNPVPDQEVSWKSDLPGVVFSPAGKSDQNGMAQVSYTSTKAQTFTLTASLGNGSSQSAPSSFVADEGSIQISDYTVTSGAIANGTATNTASVTVTDASHNPVSGETVQWSVDKTAKLSSQSGKTDINGVMAVTLSDTKAESVNVTVMLPQNAASQTKASQFIADSSSAVIQSLAASKSAVANGTATNSAEVVVVDANSNPVPDAHVTWKVSGHAVLSSADSSTGKDGHSTVNFTDTIAEPVTLTATLDNSNAKQTGSLFTSDPTTAKVTLSSINDQSMADGVTGNTIEAVVTDGQGNTLPGQTLSWRVNSSTAKIVASSKTDIQGHSRVTVTDTRGETVVVTATPENQVSNTIETHFTSYQVTALTTDVTQQTADGQSPITFTATLQDNTGKVIAGQTIAFSVTQHGVLSSAEATTSANGQAIVTLTDNQEESVTVTAKSKAWDADPGKTSTVTFKASRLTGITANGYNFGINDGFPTIGTLFAVFTLKIDNTTTHNADYNWSSNVSWISFKNPGEITFISQLTAATTARTVTVTAKPKSGTGAPLQYTFTLKHWLLNIARSNQDPSVADSECRQNGAVTPSYTLFSNAAPATTAATRAMGTFYGEWGNPHDMMGNKWSTSSREQAMWASEVGINGTRMYVLWRDGYVRNDEAQMPMDEVCQVF